MISIFAKSVRLPHCRMFLHIFFWDRNCFPSFLLFFFFFNKILCSFSFWFIYFFFLYFIWLSNYCYFNHLKMFFLLLLLLFSAFSSVFKNPKKTVFICAFNLTTLIVEQMKEMFGFVINLFLLAKFICLTTFFFISVFLRLHSFLSLSVRLVENNIEEEKKKEGKELVWKQRTIGKYHWRWMAMQTNCWDNPKNYQFGYRKCFVHFFVFFFFPLLFWLFVRVFFPLLLWPVEPKKKKTKLFQQMINSTHFLWSVMGLYSCRQPVRSTWGRTFRWQ